jgi:probable rRNA maturation factor
LYIKISVINNQKTISLTPSKVRIIKKVISVVLDKERYSGKAHITVSLLDDKDIRRLNLKYLGKDKPTDVLAFDLSLECRSKQLIADIIISCQTAKSNSALYGTSPEEELYLYVAHGMLHILGYDDRTLKQRLKMHKRQKELLGSM